MSLNFNVQPGKIFVTGEKVTTAKLNQLGVPVIQAEGTIGPGDMAAANYDAILGPGAYVYASATLSGVNYTAEYTPAVSTYADGQWFTFKVNVANPALATFNAGGGALPLYTAGGSRRPEAGEIPAAAIVTVRYNDDLNEGNGGFQILSLLAERAPADFQGASERTGGVRGLVPAARAGEQEYVLHADGRWRTPDTRIDERIEASGALANTLPQFLLATH